MGIYQIVHTSLRHFLGLVRQPLHPLPPLPSIKQPYLSKPIFAAYIYIISLKVRQKSMIGKYISLSKKHLTQKVPESGILLLWIMDPIWGKLLKIRTNEVGII